MSEILIFFVVIILGCVALLTVIELMNGRPKEDVDLTRLMNRKWKELEKKGAIKQGIAFRMNTGDERIGLLDIYGRIEWVELKERDKGL